MNSNLKKLREQRALSLTDLSQLTGINRVTINRIENNKQKPMPRTIRKLAEALEVDVELLTTRKAASFRKQNKVTSVGAERKRKASKHASRRLSRKLNEE